MESAAGYPESPMEADDAVYPCKGCGEILEEGKAFELDCFRCNTCGTILDSDANLLLLGDGSLICNNCTYSCSVCGNKIEDLAILTGDQAFCANCFKCRNCKKKIENLKYARTSQGIFCMECHESLMQRRRKKSQKNATSRHKHIPPPSNSTMLLDKSLPSLPPSAVDRSAVAAFPTENNSPISEAYSEVPTETTASHGQRPSYSRTRSDMGSPELSRTNQKRPPYGRSASSTSEKRNRSNSQEEEQKESLAPPHPSHTDRHSTHSDGSALGEDFFIPMKLDPNLAPGPSPIARRENNEARSPPQAENKPNSKDYFNARYPPTRSRTTEEPLQKLSSAESGHGSRNSSQPSSPHIAHQYQDRGRQLSSDFTSDLGRKKIHHANNNSINAVAREAVQETAGNEARPRRNGENHNGRFMLQEVPKSKKTEKRNSKERQHPLANSSGSLSKRRVDSVTANNQVKEQQVTLSPNDSSDSSRSDATLSGSPNESQPNRNHVPTEPRTSPLSTQLKNVPERGDSLNKSGQQPPPRRTVESSAPSKLSNSVAASDNQLDLPASAPPSTTIPSGAITANRSLPRSLDSPASSNFADTPPHPPLRAKERLAQLEDDSSSDSFVTPRAPPHPPSNRPKAEPSSLRNGDYATSPRLPRYNDKDDFSWEDETSRTPGTDNQQEQGGFLRRVSHSLEAEKQRVQELEIALDAKSSIKQMNSELKEKRSTMVVLDTQKQIVVRELEALTEHIAAAKRSEEPFDISKMTNSVLRDFAQSLQGLKESFQPQIEELIQRRNEVADELTAKNSQLADLNNQLVHQIQELYKANAGPAIDVRPTPNGLGIYNAQIQKEKGGSIEIREHRPSYAESNLTGSTAVPEHETEPAYLAAPQVVNIRKAQPKKFNWKRGGQNVAKGVTKGLKGAFSSEEKRGHGQKEGQYATEGMPYGAMSQQEYPRTDTYPKGSNQNRGPGFGGFFGNPKERPQQWKNSPNNSFPAVNNSDGAPRKTCHRSVTNLANTIAALFGSELELRAEYERSNIPSVVMRCIQEVDARGMDIEGIYRKSGSSSQVTAIKDGFERNNDYDISDPDLDINAVTSCLKQYFRKLPTPLITYDVYNTLLASATSQAKPEADASEKIAHKVNSMRLAINGLPPRHRDTLEVLIFHLARIVEHDRENLMTSLNVAVVFAPTIMRPESLAKEMQDTQAKNAAVQFLVENGHNIFLGREEEEERVE
ncbi:uncharacterized protein KY384_008686 [Bacidia gigantensis]|uniref:uncharacterized protein n=1 Tax=Bacidia gigantensis TaxID=2732470 RepID=UPI001D0533CD|nr:uncharacterized protein KY384_008686 [Bacidia gigantensis]KAG8526486.1 hypothetical protein KY384_008686 [Bacidia gigantensis]